MSSDYIEDTTPIFKVLVAGPQKVGKTTLIKKYVDGVFEANLQSTIGVDFSLKTMKYEEGIKNTPKHYVLQIWDVAGEDRFRDVLPNYVPGTKACIICFDSTNPFVTLEELTLWINVIKDSADNSKIDFILISTKNDLKQYTNSNKLRQFRKSFPEIIAYLPTSSLDGTNVENVFHILGTNLVKKYYSMQK